MSTRIWFAFVALLITSGISGTAQERAPERVSLDALLTRAAWYLDYFVDQFENVVAIRTGPTLARSA